MDKVTKPKKQFPCEYCGEIFSTKQNLQRHISRKHKDIEQQDDVSVMSDSTKSETNPMEYLLDTPDIPQTCQEPIPSREELIDIMNKYEKYQHLFPAIKREIKWDENNRNVDMEFHLRKHTRKFTYILFKINLFQ